jgi:phosphoglycerate dehydrogenase-like enzyme
MPRLRAVFYAAGTVQPFARPLLERGVTVVSAWHANAAPVAEFTLAQILLATKGYWRNAGRSRERRGWGHESGPGNFGETIALLGMGAVGRAVVQLLKPFQLKVIVFDPFLSDADAARLGVERVGLEEAFARGIVVSNHLADKPETKKLLGEPLFRAMRPGATFINTGRGATVDEAALIRVFGDEPSLTALLDVTDPEPPVEGSPLFDLRNVHLTSHIAGAVGDEVVRMADLCIEEFEAWIAGKPLRYAVTLPMLDRMA